MVTGTSVVRVAATDADMGINAELVYKVEKGAFDDFTVDTRTGVISVVNRLDYDLRNSYSVHIIAVDGGISQPLALHFIRFYLVF